MHRLIRSPGTGAPGPRSAASCARSCKFWGKRGAFPVKPLIALIFTFASSSLSPGGTRTGTWPLASFAAGTSLMVNADGIADSDTRAVMSEFRRLSALRRRGQSSRGLDVSTDDEGDDCRSLHA